jgi:hypothetical protein
VLEFVQGHAAPDRITTATLFACALASSSPPAKDRSPWLAYEL